MSLTFPVVGRFLAWKVGNGRHVRVGADAIVGCGENIFLQEAIVASLQELGKCTLNKIDDPVATTSWQQGWHSTTGLGLDENWSWNGRFIPQN